MICHSPSLTPDRSRNQQRTTWVLYLTLATMTAEIASGYLYGSMALLSDGIHMGTHAMALFIALLTYRLAKKFKSNGNFAFGTHKIGALGAYTSALTLIFAALSMIWESTERWINPQSIDFNQALIVAIAGLVINLISAWLLKEEPHDHSHHHAHSDSHHDHSHSEDHNLQAAYLHVLTDALTSVLAIVALFVAKAYGWLWLDAAAGILGALLILKWAWGLLRKTGSLLLDFSSTRELRELIVNEVQSHQGARLTDLHIWEVCEGKKAMICRIEGQIETPQIQRIKQKLETLGSFTHMTVEFANWPD